jgi:hypothetical protein
MREYALCGVALASAILAVVFGWHGQANHTAMAIALCFLSFLGLWKLT